MMNMLNLNSVVLVFVVIAAVWTVMTRSLVRAAMGLAVTSALLSVVMFRFNATLAAVFELSVCAGLIPVIFISTVSMTEPLAIDAKKQHMRDRLSRFWYLPFVIVLAGIILSFVNIHFDAVLPFAETEKDVRNVLWNLRPVDILGQIIILLAGAFGVTLLFKEKE